MALLPTNLVAGDPGHPGYHNQAHGKLNDIPNVVRDYGANSAGTADSSTQWNQMLSDLGNGGRAFAPLGLYRWDNEVNFGVHPGLVVEGEMSSTHNESTGYGTTIVSGTSGMRMAVVDTGSLSHWGPTLVGLNFRAKTGHTGVTCLVTKRVNRWRAERCGFRSEDADANTGILIDYVTSASDNAWWYIEQPLISNFSKAIDFGAGTYGGVITGGQILLAGSSSIGLYAQGANAASNVKVLGLFIDNGTPIKGNFNHSAFVGMKIEGAANGIPAMDLGTTLASRRNFILGLTVGGKGLGGHGVRFNSLANDNFYVFSTENLGSGGTPLINTGSRPESNRGWYFDGTHAHLTVEHWGATMPTGGHSGEIAIGNSKIWVNDGGTWKSVAVA